MTSFVVTPVMRNFVVTAIVLIVVTAPTTTQHNLNTEVRLGTKMTLAFKSLRLLLLTSMLSITTNRV